MLHFCLHGIKIKVYCEDSTLEEIFSSHYRFLRDAGKKPALGEIEIHIATNGNFSDPYLFHSQVYNNIYSLDVGLRRCAVQVHLNPNRIQVEAGHLEDLPYELVFEAVFFIPLRYAIKKWGYFFVHASSAAGDEENGILIVGDRQAGKSSLVLSLIREGCFYLAEESPILSRRTGKVQILSFPEDIGIKTDSLKNFPEISVPLNHPNVSFLKHHFPVEQLFAGKKITSSIARIILFPQYRAAGPLEIQKIHPTIALVDLMRKELEIYSEGEASNYTKEHLEVLTDLVNQCRIYQVLYNDTQLLDAAQKIIQILRTEEN